MNAFAEGIDIIFTDGNVAEDALWRTGGAGSGVTVRTIRKMPDETVAFGRSRAIMPSVIIAVRVRDVVAPGPGDTVEIDGVLFNIIAQPTRDRSGLVWGCEVVEHSQVQ